MLIKPTKYEGFQKCRRGDPAHSKKNPGTCERKSAFKTNEILRIQKKMTKTYFLWHSKNVYKMNEILRIPQKTWSKKRRRCQLTICSKLRESEYYQGRVTKSQEINEKLINFRRLTFLKMRIVDLLSTGQILNITRDVWRNEKNWQRNEGDSSSVTLWKLLILARTCDKSRL